MTSLQAERSPQRHRGRQGHVRFAHGPEASLQEDAVRDETPPEDALTQAISKAAYYRAEARGFEPGHEMEDWIAAEQDVTAPRQAADDPDD